MCTLRVMDGLTFMISLSYHISSLSETGPWCMTRPMTAIFHMKWLAAILVFLSWKGEKLLELSWNHIRETYTTNALIMRILRVHGVQLKTACLNVELESSTMQLSQTDILNIFCVFRPIEGIELYLFIWICFTAWGKQILIQLCEHERFVLCIVVS